MKREDKEKLVALHFEQEARKCRASLYYFLKSFWNTCEIDTFVDNWHIAYLCGRVQEISERAIRGEKYKNETLVVNIPPSTSKSTIITQMLPAWLWTIAPYFSICVSTSSMTLSSKNSRKGKLIVKSRKYQNYFDPYFLAKYGTAMRLTKDLDSLWVNNLKGERHFRSVTGTITGDHFHLKIIDDPIDAYKADSEKMRNQAYRHVFEVLSTRNKQHGVTPTILVMQRLHQEDPSGIYIERGCDLIKLPATVNGDVIPAELKDNYVNGLLSPIRLSQKELDRQLKTLGSLQFAGQFMQEPKASGGTIIKSEYFKYCDIQDVPSGITDLWIDTAYTESKKNDPSGILVIRHAGGKLYILNAINVRKEFNALIDAIQKIAIENIDYNGRIYVEPKASGLSVIQVLRANDYPTMKIKGRIVSDGKNARAQLIAYHAEQERIILVRGAWNKDFIDQMEIFPNGTHDEYIDCLGYACNRKLKRFGDDNK